MLMYYTYQACSCEWCNVRPAPIPQCNIISSLNPCHLECPFCWELWTTTSWQPLEVCGAGDNLADFLQSWGTVSVTFEVLLVVHWVDQVATVITRTIGKCKDPPSNVVIDISMANLWNSTMITAGGIYISLSRAESVTSKQYCIYASLYIAKRALLGGMYVYTVLHKHLLLLSPCS